MGARLASASSRGHSPSGPPVLALCAAALLVFPQAVLGELRLFGTEGFRTGFGADYLSELQKSLTISSSSGTVTVHDLEDGSTVTEPLGSDPRLLNRKVDIEWSMDGPGVQIPVSGSLGTGWGRVQTTFSLQAREGDFDLRFLNQREQGADDSLHGRGTFYGAEVGVATLCQDCPWFIESGFRFQKLAGADAERSPSFVSPGLRLMGDESRLSRETRDAFARFGYSFTGTNITTYTGVRHRWADVEVEDELRLFDPQFNQETTMRSRTKLDSSATEAIVGVEVQRRFRRGTFKSGAEITFNEEDYGIFAVVSYNRRLNSPPDDPEVERAARIAEEIAPRLARIRDEFVKGRRRLPTAEIPAFGRAYLARPLERLLDKTELDLLGVLDGHAELIALRDYIVDLFRRARGALYLQSTTRSGSMPLRALLASQTQRPIYLRTRLENMERSVSTKEGDSWLDQILANLKGIARQARYKDLLVSFCVISRPEIKAHFRMRPISYDPVDPPDTFTNDRMANVYRGRYRYTVELSGFDPFSGTVNLVRQTPPFILCELSVEKGQSSCKPSFWKHLGKECPYGT